MSKGLSLLDFVYLNQKTDFASNELKSLIKTHGSLEYNIGKHIRLMNKIPEIDKRFGGTQWLNSRPFKLLVEKILEIESRIDKYILLMYDTEVDLPDTVFNYVRLQDLINYYKGNSVGEKDPLKRINLTEMMVIFSKYTIRILLKIFLIIYYNKYQFFIN